MKLYDLMSLEHLSRMIDEGYVRVRTHPHAPWLRIFNYTEKAQYEKMWDLVTKQCRGLVVDGRDQTVLARPFDKFFNYGELTVADSLKRPQDHNGLVHVSDKMDGSLGILYPWPERRDDLKWAVATRGSFESEQAIHATDLLRRKYPFFEPATGWTYLFEIVYPENRIVLDYGETDDLFLLGARHIESGKIEAALPRWPGPVTQSIGFGVPFERALKISDRQNREGIVIRFLASDFMLKIKQDDYVALHKIVTGLNERTVWEHLAAHNGTYGELLAQVPDEFHGWVTLVAEGLLDEFEALQGWAHNEYLEICDDLDTKFGGRYFPEYAWERKDFARLARESEHPALMFQMLDGRDISAYIWKTLKPKGQTKSLINQSEATA